MVSDADLLQDLTRRLAHTSPFVYVPPGWGLRTMRARAEAPDRLVKVDVWGDSIWAQGLGASDPRTNGAAGLLEAHLTSRWGDGGSGFLSHEYATKTGTWASANENMFGGCGARATAAATLQWEGLRGDTIRFWHRNTLAGSFRWQANGGPFTTVTPPTGFSVEPGFLFVSGLGPGPHTFRVEWLSGIVVAHGVQGLNARGVVVNRFGQNGRAGSHYAPVLLERIPSLTRTNGGTAISTAAPGSFRPSMAGKYLVADGIPLDTTIASVSSATAAALSANATASGAVTADLQLHRGSWSQAASLTIDPAFSTGVGRADLVVIALGANDPANLDYTASTYADGVSRIIAQYTSGNAYDFTPDFAFFIQHFGNWFDILSRKNQIASAVQGLAGSVSGVVIDAWSLGRRSWLYANNQGWFADNIHPTSLGHRKMYAEPLIGLLP